MENQEEAELCFPQLLNDSCRKPKKFQAEFVLYFLFFISVLTVILNLLVIISITHFRQLHTPTNLLLLSLAVSDFLYGLLVTPLKVHRLMGCWFLDDFICSLSYYFSSFCYSASIWDMILLSVDRYVAICDPLHYPTRITVRRVRICIYVGRLFSLVYNGIILKDDLIQPGRYNSCYGQCRFYVDSILGTFDIVVLFFFPVTAIIVLYMRVFLTAVSQARAMRSHVAATTLHHSGTVLTKKSELKAARTLGIVVFGFLICFSPYFFLFFVQEIPDSALIVALFMLCVNPCMNPVIYALFYPWFRKSVRLIMSLQILQPGSRETNML